MNKFSLRDKYLIPALVVGAILLVGAGGFLFYQHQKTQSTNANPNNPQVAQQEVKKLVSEVGKLIDLPTGEDPTVATVTDFTKLKDQPFFAKAKNGDKVLIYTNARKAILYDPNAKKVLDVAPINIGSSSAAASGPKIVLRNGTTTIGLTTKVESEIKQVQPQVNVIIKENAGKSSYDTTIVVILNTAFKDQATSLVTILKGSQMGDLPQGEVKPKDGDILIILGKDRI